jgi:hypothetical protein
MKIEKNNKIYNIKTFYKLESENYDIISTKKRSSGNIKMQISNYIKKWSKYFHRVYMLSKKYLSRSTYIANNRII